MNRPLSRLFGLLAASAAVFALTATTAHARGGVTGALSYVPADFSTVIAVNVDGIRSSALFELVSSIAGQDDAVRMMQRETGIDPVKDIRAIVIAGPDDFICKED